MSRTCPVCAAIGVNTPVTGTTDLCRPHYLRERRIKEALRRLDDDDELLAKVAASSQADVARQLEISRQTMKHRVDAATARRRRLVAAGMKES